MIDPTVLVSAVTGISLVASAAITGLLARTGRGRDTAVEEKLALTQATLEAVLLELSHDKDVDEPKPKRRSPHHGT